MSENASESSSEGLKFLKNSGGVCPQTPPPPPPRLQWLQDKPLPPFTDNPSYAPVIVILSTITYHLYSLHCPHYHHGSLSEVVALPGIQSLSEVVALPGIQSLSEVVALPGIQSLSEMVALPGK